MEGSKKVGPERDYSNFELTPEEDAREQAQRSNLLNQKDINHFSMRRQRHQRMARNSTNPSQTGR